MPTLSSQSEANKEPKTVISSPVRRITDENRKVPPNPRTPRDACTPSAQTILLDFAAPYPFRAKLRRSRHQDCRDTKGARSIEDQHISSLAAAVTENAQRSPQRRTHSPGERRQSPVVSRTSSVPRTSSVDKRWLAQAQAATSPNAARDEGGKELLSGPSEVFATPPLVLSGHAASLTPY